MYVAGENRRDSLAELPHERAAHGKPSRGRQRKPINDKDMIQIENLHYAYAGSRKTVFNDFNLRLENNRIYGLLGKNGTGKSTLLYLICGLLRQKQGTITIDGIDSRKHDPELLSEMFIIPEEFDLMPVKLEDYILLNKPFYPRFDREILMSCLSDFELNPDINLKQLSMGQKKKVYMSFALAANTRYLFMDEPTNGLDIPSKSQFRKVIANNMTDDRTLVISTHQVHDVESLLDHIIMLDQSRLKLDAGVADITERYTFQFRAPGEPMDDVLYAEPSLQGNAVIAKKRPGDEDTTLNLELLFNAVVKGKLSL